jgi:hypothetical protein
MTYVDELHVEEVVVTTELLATVPAYWDRTPFADEGCAQDCLGDIILVCRSRVRSAGAGASSLI